MGVLCLTAATSYHAANYDRPLRALCRDVEVFHYGPDMSRSYWDSAGRGLRARSNLAIRELAHRLAAEGRLGVVFASVYDDALEEETLRLLRRLGAVLVNHMVDMPIQWYRLLRTAPYFDLIAIAHRAHEDHLRGRANALLYLPMAASPDEYGPTEPAEEGPGVSFVGSWMPTRAAILLPLRARFPDMEIWGSWSGFHDHTVPARRRIHDLAHYLTPRLRAEGSDLLARALWRGTGRFRGEAPEPPEHLSRGPIGFREMVQLFGTSVVNLGITQSEGPLEARWAPRWVRGRDFEVPMCRGFYLVQRAAEHEEHFVLGEEIEVWETFDELVDKVAYYTNHPGKARAIAERGYRRALRDHTWRSRFERLFSFLGREAELREQLPSAACDRQPRSAP